MPFRTNLSLNNLKRKLSAFDENNISDIANIIMSHSAFNNCSIEESLYMNQDLTTGTTLKEVMKYIEDQIALGTGLKNN